MPQGDSYQDKWESQLHSREETSGQFVLFLTLFAVFNIDMSAQHSSKIVDQIHFQTKKSQRIYHLKYRSNNIRNKINKRILTFTLTVISCTLYQLSYIDSSCSSSKCKIPCTGERSLWFSCSRKLYQLISTKVVAFDTLIFVSSSFKIVSLLSFNSSIFLRTFNGSINSVVFSCT